MNDIKVNSFLPARFTPWLVFLSVLLSRILWLSNVSLGKDRDAWSTGLVAQKIAGTFTYEASRLPGYPFVEIVSAFFSGGPIWVYNLLTAIMSALCATFFYLWSKQLRSQYPLWLTFAFAFSMTVYIQSLELMDYMWALCFVMGAFYYNTKKKYGLSGAFLGLAVACRITSGAMLIPLVILFYEDFKANRRLIVPFATGFILPVVLFFIPVIYTYGFNFFSYYGDNSHLSFKLLAKTLTINLWGYLGALGWVIGLGYALIVRKSIHDNDKKLMLVCLIVTVLYILAFLKLPHETEYLLPIVPFALILLDRFVTNRKVLIASCILIGISSMVDITPKGIFSPVYEDKMTKISLVKASEKTMQKFKKLVGDKDFILVARHYRPMYLYLYKEMDEKNIYRALSCEELAAFHQKGVQVFVLDPTFIDDCNVVFTDLSAYQAAE